MRDRRDEPRFAFEPREHLGPARHFGGKDFDSDFATETRVTRAIDLAHAARADRRDDLVRT